MTGPYGWTHFIHLVETIHLFIMKIYRVPLQNVYLH